jgi:hypothetical protein
MPQPSVETEIQSVKQATAKMTVLEVDNMECWIEFADLMTVREITAVPSESSAYTAVASVKLALAREHVRVCSSPRPAVH